MLPGDRRCIAAGRPEALSTVPVAMDHKPPGFLRDPDGRPGMPSDWDSLESIHPEEEQKGRHPSSMTEDLNGSWSQRSLSRSLQRAETLLRSTFHPGLKWLLQGYSRDDEEEEGSFIVAHNFVSRSSSRLLRLQEALLTVAPKWRQVGRVHKGVPQFCFKGLPSEGNVHILPSVPVLHDHYRSLRQLLEQRSLLLFIHEHTRRARLTAAFMSRLRELLENPKSDLTFDQSSGSSFRSLCQEFRVHLNHQSCLFTKIQSDHYLQSALALHSKLLPEIRHSLDLLGLQVLVLMECHVHAILSSIAQADLDDIPPEVLEDILVSTKLYNMTVEEQRTHHITTKLRTAVLQRACCSTNLRGLRPSTFSVIQLLDIFALHHGNTAAKELHCWFSQQKDAPYRFHSNHGGGPDKSGSQFGLSHGACAPAPKQTWKQLQDAYLSSDTLLLNPLHHTCHKSSSVYIPDLYLDSTISEIHHHRLDNPVSVTSSKSNPARVAILENCQLLQVDSLTFDHHPLVVFCQKDHSTVELLFEVLLSSKDPLIPLVSPAPTPIKQTAKTDPAISQTPLTDGADSEKTTEVRQSVKEHDMEETQQERAEMEIIIKPTPYSSLGCGWDKDLVKEEVAAAEGSSSKEDYIRRPRSVQWLDLGQSLVMDDLHAWYCSLLWTRCSRALWLWLHTPPARDATGSINLHDDQRRFQILHTIAQASKTDLLPSECRVMLEDFSLELLGSSAHAHWDCIACRSLGSAMRDKCLPDPSNWDGVVMTTATAELLLQLFPPLMSSLVDGRDTGSAICSPRLSVQRKTAAMLLAAAQMSTVWVTSKAHQFLSSWSLDKFLLITQGDLKALRESLDAVVQQIKPLVMNPDRHPSTQNHNQALLRQQAQALSNAASELQTFTCLMLKDFSADCKRMSGEIFEQRMPSASHWRLKTGFPSSHSEYASLAAQAVMGQVLEGAGHLTDSARTQALGITLTAFMEAWMEHILKQRIKFSIQGALQLKQDFDSIRDLIRSDRAGLSEELNQQLLSLRVFQQVDSAVLCLLQQPQVKPYLRPRAWEPLTRCCPTKSSRDGFSTAGGSSITNLGCVEGDDASPSSLTSDMSLFSPREPYLAPSLALGASQQDWLDLRIHGGSRRWRLPGLQCLSNTEP